MAAADHFPLPQLALARIRRAQRIVALTGAGISAESGIPTFRDAQTGLWARFDPLELATPSAFTRNPKLVWDWYVWRRERVAAALPNAGHHALVAIEQAAPEFLLVTQNVDGLHHAAGSRKLIELHGNIRRVKCSSEGTPALSWDPPRDGEPPRCASCGAFLRPDVVWFEEALPQDAIDAATDAALHCDVLLVIGTSAEVHPAAQLPVLARDRGAMIIEVNPNPTRLTPFSDVALAGRAGEILPALVAQAWGDATARRSS